MPEEKVEGTSWWVGLDRSAFQARVPVETARMRNTEDEQAPGVKKALAGILWLEEAENRGIPTRRQRVTPSATPSPSTTTDTTPDGE